MSFELIETVTVGAGGAASIEFTSIPQDGTDLVLLVSARNADLSASDNLTLAFNSSTADFTNRNLFGTGSSVGSVSFTNRILGGITGDIATASTFSNTSLLISNYAGSTAKSWSADAVAENNATSTGHSITAGLWNNTSAITAITLTGSGNFLANTTAYLYKIF